MKLLLTSIALLASVSSFAQANYENWMGSAADVTCGSKKEAVLLEKTKMTLGHDEENGTEYVESLELRTTVQVAGTEYKRRYLVKSVLVDSRAFSEFPEAKLQPTIITGKHAKTGESFKLLVPANQDKQATLIIGGKKQIHKNLVCSIMFAG